MNTTILQKVQEDLQKIYQVNVDLPITDFLINENIFSSLCCKSKIYPCSDKIRGVTLLSAKDRCLDLAIYIQEEILENLSSNNPKKRLDMVNISDFFVIAEEVSHFIYAAWKAKNHIPITKLELEIQAEVDKYILSAVYMGIQNHGRIPAILKEFLFDLPVFQDGISTEQRERYLKANYLASRYCHFLEKSFLKQSLLSAMIKEIRKFYRLTQSEKISSINQKIFYH